MLCCSECGAPKLEKVQRGPLYATVGPDQVYWKGVPLDITPSQKRIMTLLIRFGRVSHLSLQTLCAGENTTSDSIKVQMTFHRRKLPAGIGIVSERGWGYRLEVAG